MTDHKTYSYGNGGWTLTAAQVSELAKTLNKVQVTSTLNPEKQGLATELYDKLLSFLPRPVAVKDLSEPDMAYLQTYTWIKGARDVNAGEGVFSTYIRSYTEEQYQLRIGPIKNGTIDKILNATSNEIGIRLIDSIINNNGVLPSIEGIGIVDGGEAASQLFKSRDYPNGDFTGWSGAVLFSFIGYDDFFKDWLLNIDSVDARVLNGSGVADRTVKKFEGAYDLFAALQSNLHALENYDFFEKARAGFNSLFIIDNDQDDLIKATNDYVTRLYDLPEDHVFRAGERLPFASAWTYYNSELGVKVGHIGERTGYPYDAYNDKERYENYIIHGTPNSEAMRGYVNESPGALASGSVLFDGGGGDFDSLSYASTEDATTRLHVTLEDIISPLHDWRFSVGKFRESSDEWGHDYAYAFQFLEASMGSDILSVKDIPVLKNDLFIDLAGGGQYGDTLDFSRFDHPVDTDSLINNMLITAGGGKIVFTPAENIIGSLYNDELTSGNYRVIEGGPGENLITGGSQANTFVVSQGINTITDAQSHDRLVVRLPGEEISGLTSDALTLGGGFILRSAVDNPGTLVNLTSGDTAVFYPIVPNPFNFTPSLSGTTIPVDPRVDSPFMALYSLNGTTLHITTKFLHDGNVVSTSETFVEDYHAKDLGLEFRELIVPNYTNAASNQGPMQKIIDTYVDYHQGLLQSWERIPTPPDLWMT